MARMPQNTEEKLTDLKRRDEKDNENSQGSSRVINGLGMVSRGVPALVGCAIKGFPWEKSTEQRRQALLAQCGGDLNQALHAVFQEVSVNAIHSMQYSMLAIYGVNARTHTLTHR